MLRCLALTLAASIATACASSPDKPPVIVTRLVTPAVPAAARVPCQPPAALPDRDLTAGETVNLWGRDRASLRVCENRRAAAVTAATTIPSLEPARD